MLKKALTCAAVTGAAVAAGAAGAAPAAASDTAGAAYSQNVNVLNHLCVDVHDIQAVGLVNVIADVLSEDGNFNCDEQKHGAVKVTEDKAPASDLLDTGNLNH